MDQFTVTRPWWSVLDCGALDPWAAVVQVNDETEIDDAVLCDEKMDPNVAADLMRSGHGAWNVDASRVLQRVRQKLRGQEDPLGEPLAVSGQVSYLINAAQDPENLAQMFYGWAPWV